MTQEARSNLWWIVFLVVATVVGVFVAVTDNTPPHPTPVKPEPVKPQPKPAPKPC